MNDIEGKRPLKPREGWGKSQGTKAFLKGLGVPGLLINNVIHIMAFDHIFLMTFRALHLTDQSSVWFDQRRTVVR